jgi:hypothetical protein
VTGDLHNDRSIADDGVEAADDAGWTPEERAVLDAALEFYAASATVIDYAAPEGPHLRQDAAGFDAVRRAMAVLEDRVRAAGAAGTTPERIAEIARLDHDMVVLILERGEAAPSPSEG